MKILITGSQGFIGSYLCQELLQYGHTVFGIDNYSKYGKIARPQDNLENFHFFEQDILDCKKFQLRCYELRPDIIIAGAAMIGGIAYFHKHAYDLLATNERILANTFDTAIHLYKMKILKSILVISSSMVFECATEFPSVEDSVRKISPPLSTYGFQKLSSEYFCQGAYEQYGLPYNIVRPFNCVGVGENDAKTIGMSHVVPDLVYKTLKGGGLHILGDGNQKRCYTNGKDIARGIRLIIESDIYNEDYNISSNEAVTVKELATKIWNMIRPLEKLNLVHDTPYLYDVQKRIPDTTKAKEKLQFTADISLDESIREVIEYIKKI